MPHYIIHHCLFLCSCPQVNPSVLFVSHPSQPLLMQDFVTYYPALTTKRMVTVFLYDLNRQIASMVNMENNNVRLAKSVCGRISSSELEPQLSSCNYSYAHSQISGPRLQVLHTEPTTLYDVARWEIVTDNKIYNSEKSIPVSGLPRQVKLEVEFVLNRTLAALREGGSRYLVKIHNVYLRYSGLLGREYILDLDLTSETATQLLEKRVTVLLPHLENLFQIESRDYLPPKKTIEFVVPLSGVNSRLRDFLEMYEDLCLRTEEACSLNLVVYGEKDFKLIKKQVRVLQQKYPMARLTQILGEGRFSRGRALELGVAKLSADALVFICDVDMMIERSFLMRCRRNPLRGTRAYYPEFFKYYNMDYVYRFSKMPWGRSISRQHGHWAMYSYGMLCIYVSDYVRTGGFNPYIEGWGGEDVDLANRVLKKGLDILRAPDPALSHRYHDKVCSTNLTPRQFASCISSRNEDLADRTQLAEYVFYLEDRCVKKGWKLWSNQRQS